MERLLSGLTGFSIRKILSWKPVRIEAVYEKETQCPACESKDKRIKASFWRDIKSIPHQGRPVTIKIRCHKYHCKSCGRYFNTLINGVKKWSRSTEPLKNTVFKACSRGYSNRDAAAESGVSVAAVERFYVPDFWRRRALSQEQCPNILDQ